MIKKLTKQLRIGLALFLAVFANGMMPAMAAYADAPGNNGTIKVHEKGTPSGSESNDPKVCVFNFEAFGLDANQTGNITIETQSGTVITPVVVSLSTDSSGNGSTEYLNDTNSTKTIVDGHYKATLDTKFGTDPGNKAKSKVFKVECGVSANPATFNDPCGLGNDSYTIPTTQNVIYKVGGVAKAAGTYSVASAVMVTVNAEAVQPYTLTGTASWSHTFTDVPCTQPGKVKPVAPTVVDPCGVENDSLVAPANTSEVSYSVSHTGSVWTVTATPSANFTLDVAGTDYVLQNDGTATWTKTLTDRACKVVICHATASASNPYVKIEVAVESVDGDLTNDNGNGDHYSEHLGPVYPTTGVDGKWGDIIPKLDYIQNHEGRNWDAAGQAILRNDCNIPVEISVTAGPCAYFDTTSSISITVTGTAKDSTLVVYDASNNVVKTIDIEVDNDGNVTSPTFPVEVNGLSAGTYTVKVEKGEKVLASATVVVALCLYDTNPVEPTVRDYCYDDHDYIVIPNTEGVIYKVNGLVESGYVAFTGTLLEVTAEAVDGYELTGYEGSWTFDSSDFTDENCLTITKTAKVASDTNHDGVIGLGDEITWEVTVTNNSDKECESFYVTVDDPNAVLENDGLIEHLGAGESSTLTATSTIKSADIQLCKAVNIASFSAWRLDRHYQQEPSILSDDNSYEQAPLATGEAQASYTLNCPTPGRGSITPPTTVVAELPQAGPEQDSITNLLIGLTASVLVYRSLLWRQERKAALGL